MSPVKVEVLHLAMATFVKLPPPRQLTQNESLDSLDHWKSIFRSYFRRDSIFRQLGCFKEVLCGFLGSLREFPRCFKEVLGVFRENFKGDSRENLGI